MDASTPFPCQPTLISLPYHANALLDYFAPLSQMPWAMLLFSGGATHPHNRFDILVADPVLTLQTRNQQTIIDHGDQQTIYNGDPLTVLQQQLEKILPKYPASVNLPFCGGAVGLWGYDLGRCFEHIPPVAQQDLFTSDMAVGIYDWALIADHQRQQLTLLSWRDAPARLTWLQNQQKNVATDAFSLTASWQSNFNRQQYEYCFSQIQQYLSTGDCYQVNLTQRFSASYTGDEWLAFLRLNQQNMAPFSAFIRLPDSAILSVSPERFIHLEQQTISTRPIKGTISRLTDPQQDHQQALKLAMSSKDQSENLMIVDLMRNDMGRVATPGSVHVSELFVVEKFPAVYHLVSTITATLPNNLSATDLLRACFPGGSITGAPKIRAMQIIEELEPQRRNAYCGSIGYISCCGTMDTNITIRTLLAENGKLHCWAGGGIVADSQIDAEYQEVLDKLSKILPILGDSEIIA